jgi:hypothetical protein
MAGQTAGRQTACRGGAGGAVLSGRPAACHAATRSAYLSGSWHGRPGGRRAASASFRRLRSLLTLQAWALLSRATSRSSFSPSVAIHRGAPPSMTSTRLPLGGLPCGRGLGDPWSPRASALSSNHRYLGHSDDQSWPGGGVQARQRRRPARNTSPFAVLGAPQARHRHTHRTPCPLFPNSLPTTRRVLKV